MLDIKPAKEIVGFPVVPFALAIDRPFVTANVTPVRVFAPVFTCKPTGELNKDAAAPVKAIVYVP
jgi:hypothetical protein